MALMLHDKYDNSHPQTIISPVISEITLSLSATDFSNGEFATVVYFCHLFC